jgi:hypothetical protein
MTIKKEREADFYLNYVRHLPQVPVDAPVKRGSVHHLVYHHDEWCSIYRGSECNCNVIITRHEEVKRN